MAYRWFTRRKLALIPGLLALVFLIACGGAASEAPTAAPQAPTAAPQPVATTAAGPAPATASTQSTEPTKITTAMEPPKAPSVAMEPTAIPTAAPKAAAPPVADWVSIAQNKHYNGVLPIATCSKPGFWDVHYGGSSCSTLRPSQPRFNGLLEWNPVQPDEIQGDLAESWKISDDGKVYTFQIHEAQWSDGQPVTAEDVVFTLERIVEPDAIRARTAALRRFYEPGTAEVIDTRTVRVPTKIRAVTFMLNMASDYIKIYPKHFVEGQSQDDLNCCPENLIGSGPWMFKEWTRGESYEYERNPNYFKEGRPFFDGFKAFFIKDKARLLSAFKIGQLSMSYSFLSSSIQPGDLAVLADETDGKLRPWVILDSSRELYMKWDEPPFDDPRVRRAIYLAIDRQEISDVVWKGFAKPGSFFPLGMVEDQAELAQIPGYRHPKDQDIAEAKKLLAEAGYPDGFKTSLNILNTSASILSHGELLTDMLRKNLSIDAELNPVDLATYYVQLRDGTHPLSLGGTGYPVRDPSETLTQFFQRPALRNPYNWSHPRIDELMAVQEGEFDPATRLAMFDEIAEILHQGEAHYVPIIWFPLSGVYDYRIQNFHVPSFSQNVTKLEHLWWDPDAKVPDQ